MKHNILFLLLVAGLSPMAVHATLLGRVNSYYDPTAIQKVKDAKAELAAAADSLSQKKQISPALTQEAQQTVDSKRKQLSDILNTDVSVKHPGTDGVRTAFVPSVEVSTVTGGGNAIDIPAYQYTIPFMKSDCDNTNAGKKSRLIGFGEEACSKDNLTGYRMLPMYILLHKTVISAQTSANGAQIALHTLANDILDNEHGGLVNLKFTPSFFDTAYAPSSEYAPHISVIGDFGYKYVEQPLPDLKAASHLSAGYVGFGINAEFSVMDKGADIRQLTGNSLKPAGYLALGVGAYRNTVNGVDNTFFAAPVPRYFNSYFAGGELQITNLISAVFSHVLPTVSNSLGSFTSISIKYQTP